MNKNQLKFPEEEWDLPAGFTGEGNLASLRELANPYITTYNLGEVSNKRHLRNISGRSLAKELVIARLEKKSNYEMHVLGEGLITKDRAIEEIEKDTQLGKYLVRYEQTYLTNLYKAALQRSKNNAH